VNAETQGGILILTGGVVARMAVSGTYLLYVRQGMRPWLLSSALVLVVLGCLRVWSALRPGPAAAAGPAAGHGHEPHAPAVAWLLVLPVLAVVLIAPNPLGSFTAARQSATVAVVAPPDPFPPLERSADGTVALPVMEFVRRALFDDRRSLAGVPVRLVGMVAPAAKGGTEDFRLVRFMIACCAADAQAVQVAVHGVPGSVPPTDAWVEVVGRWRAPTAAEADDQVPPFVVDEIRTVPRPESPYEG
jgi:uncharacterized repeat protein (TIGR03943 family)